MSNLSNRPDSLKYIGTPNTTKQLRACLECKLVKSRDQFLKDGCEACKYLFGKDHLQRSVDDYTTASFEGIISVSDSSRSWAAKYLGQGNFPCGVYALKVIGDDIGYEN